MGWIKRKANEHQCNLPKHDYKMTVGDIWQCDECRKQHQIIKIEFEDRPCGNVWVRWMDLTPPQVTHLPER